ncbi:hypothetical protein Ln9_0033 [Leuconostoc phage Ln-9]|uniref:Uncharacterized protein n=1 Tax=Leuconostoc phage Ln-9 TaxID=1536605 RepID=A0A0D3MJV2_9CAUD|nr:hypothetical protein ACQ47_gp33 [Leuconostoc phage Ln-9]AIM50882.1 hypothetical protein Ln9_0033 [Leuconostoc phage Ln-9]
MSEVFVKIKDKKHAIKVMKRLVRIGYKKTEFSTDHKVRTICVFSDGTYQLLTRSDCWGTRIKPKDVMNSEPVYYFLERNHV